MQLHPHSGRRPAAFLHGGRGDPESAADGFGNPAGGVGQPPQPAGPEDGAHRGHRQGTLVSPCRILAARCGAFRDISLVYFNASQFELSLPMFSNSKVVCRGVWI